jgi:prevent-host-death family protein
LYELQYAEEQLMEDLSTDYLRKHLGEVFDRVQYAGKLYVVKRKGKEIGAIVPVELFRRLQQAARSNLARLLDQQRAAGDDLTDDQAMDKAAEAVSEYRTRRI